MYAYARTRILAAARLAREGCYSGMRRYETRSPHDALRMTNVSALFSSESDSQKKQSFMHLPLGSVPDGTDLSVVRHKWGSNAMDLIQQVPPIEVEGNVAVCDGGGGAEGHPIEYIKLDSPYPAVCKYCGLRYVSKKYAPLL
uniref:Zinc finger CHCC-type domain-containing protein n=1 Tax=Erythrolobus madagascarensis TaxID=708628 RepID=A0A7S0T4V0_9RHOD|mmetsp:Transcript_1068/g.2099  ORF Transcript_1068/g.2099 Transcript_1068/m.2099 type:complete len:142 (+) Transcript_1068:149-574(+)